MKISYIPSKDELVLKFRPLKQKPTKEVGGFKLWWDDEGCIYGLVITSFTEKLKEFNVAKLSGIWKGVRVTEEDIKEVREDLLKKIEEK